jgi:sec-independent protein translocase protein TatB
VFNLSGSEIVFIMLAALVLLGPEKLPEALRRVGRVYAEVRKISQGFQSELRNAIEEPAREIRETTQQAKSAFSLKDLTASGSTSTPATKATGAAIPAADDPDGDQTTGDTAPVIDAVEVPAAPVIDAVEVAAEPVIDAVGVAAEPVDATEQPAASQQDV